MNDEKRDDLISRAAALAACNAECANWDDYGERACNGVHSRLRVLPAAPDVAALRAALEDARRNASEWETSASARQHEAEQARAEVERLTRERDAARAYAGEAWAERDALAAQHAALREAGEAVCHEWLDTDDGDISPPIKDLRAILDALDDAPPTPAREPVEPALALPSHDPGHPHLIGGEFQSDKYPTCPRGKVPLSCKDRTAQDLLWEYAQRRRKVDAEFSDDLEAALRIAGYEPARAPVAAEPPSEAAPGLRAAVLNELDAAIRDSVKFPQYSANVILTSLREVLSRALSVPSPSREELGRVWRAAEVWSADDSLPAWATKPWESMSEDGREVRRERGARFLALLSAPREPAAQSAEAAKALKCRTCGCLWRRNVDGTVSFLDAAQRSCPTCEGDTSARTCDEACEHRTVTLKRDPSGWPYYACIACGEGVPETPRPAAAPSAGHEWRGARCKHCDATTDPGDRKGREPCPGEAPSAAKGGEMPNAPTKAEPAVASEGESSPSWGVIRSARAAAEWLIDEGRRMERDGQEKLREAVREERKARARGAAPADATRTPAPAEPKRGRHLSAVISLVDAQIEAWRPTSRITGEGQDALRRLRALLLDPEVMPRRMVPKGVNELLRVERECLRLSATYWTGNPEYLRTADLVGRIADRLMARHDLPRAAGPCESRAEKKS